MNAVAFVQNRITESLTGNPDEIVTELRTRNTLLQKLLRREIAWRDAVTAWLLADREQLVVTVDGVPCLVHQLFERDDYARIHAAIAAVVEGGIPQSLLVRFLCSFCRDVKCGGETQCASDVDHDRILRVRMPNAVQRAAERVVEVRQMAGEVTRG